MADPARDEPGRSTDVAVGLAATAFRAGLIAGRVVTSPARLLARSFLLEPIVRDATDGLADSGRRAEARARRRAEDAAAELLGAPETVRTVDRALTGPVPAALTDESIERIARKLLESPAFERMLREAAESRVAQDLTDEALHSAELQRAVEEILAGPGVRNALRRETRTLRDDVTERVRAATGSLDDRLERGARRAFGRAERAPSVAYAGLTGRLAAIAADIAITHLALLAVASAVGLLGWLLGLSAPGWVIGALLGAGWSVVVGGYVVLFWATAGQTPGMRLFGLRVVGPGDRPPSVGRSVLRLAGTVLALAPLGAGFVPVLFDGRRRALQDFLARTVVVRDVELRPAAASPQRSPSRPTRSGDSSAASTS